MKVLFLTALLLTLTGQQANGPSERPVVVPAREAAEHLIGDPPFLRVSREQAQRLTFSATIRIHVTVNPKGSVLTAKALFIPELDRLFPEEICARAVSIVRGLHYSPFQRGGRPVAAEFDQYVSLLPPELLPSRQVPFPKVKTLKSVKITLDRSGCFGTCPSYKVVLHGDGRVEYDGEAYVALTGHHVGSIPKEDVLELLTVFKDADYFSLDDEYTMSVTDNPTYRTSIEIDGKKKEVTDYVGVGIGMPISVARLEHEIDRLSNSERWVRGNADTVPALKAEHWDFKSPDATVTLLRIAGAGSAEAVRDFINAGVPLVAKEGSGPTHPDWGAHGYRRVTGSVLVAAADRGDLAMLDALIDAGAGADTVNLNKALVAVTGAGNVEAFRLLARNGASLDAQDSDGRTILMCAALSGSPTMVKEVLKYQPDVNAVVQQRDTADAEKPVTRSGANIPDRRGRTALIEAVYQNSMALEPEAEFEGVDRSEVVRLLLSAGAAPNARDENGDTALILCTDRADIALLLIKAGADVNARNKEGKAPLDNANSADVKRVLLEHGAKEPGK